MTNVPSRENDLDINARALFDAQPHNHPRGNVPNWNIQPEHLKDVFRRKAAADTQSVPKLGDLLRLDAPYLESKRFALLTDSQDVESAIEGLDLPSVSGVMADAMTGELWVTEWSQPWLLTASYELVRTGD